MPKRDLKKELRYLYHAPSKEAVLVDIPEMAYLMVDGEGDPNTSQTFAEAIEALYSVAYTVKFMVRNGPEAIDYGVMPLEALWWADDMSSFSDGDKSKWKWTVMIMQPDFVSSDLIEQSIAEVAKKKNPAALSLIRYERFTEGRCAQIMHIGPFSEEGPAIEKVHRFIDSIGTRSGRHHEIYLSDIRRAAPEKWKTIVRQPFD